MTDDERQQTAHNILAIAAQLEADDAVRSRFFADSLYHACWQYLSWFEGDECGDDDESVADYTNGCNPVYGEVTFLSRNGNLRPGEVVDSTWTPDGYLYKIEYDVGGPPYATDWFHQSQVIAGGWG